MSVAVAFCSAASFMGLYGKFAEYYDLLYKQLVDYGKETDVIEKILMKLCEKKPTSVLDVGCGTGSHTLLLSKRGYSVTGIDVSNKMIEEAERKAQRENSKAEFCVQDMRYLDLNKKFDCAICMFGGFGYVLTYEDLVKTFSSLKGHLQKNGLLIYEFWNVGGIRPSPYLTWIRAQDEDLVLYRLSESNFDPQRNVLTMDFHFIELRKNKPAETFDETHKVRCYTLPEMRNYLEDNGFELVVAYDWSKNAEEFKTPERETFRILAVSRMP